MWKTIIGLVTSKSGISVAIALVVGVISAIIISQYLQIRELKSLYADMTKDYLISQVKIKVSEENLDGCRKALDAQNVALLDTKVDLENLEKEKAKKSEKIRYIKVPESDSCLSKLKLYETIFTELGTNKERMKNENRSLQNAAGKK